MEVNLTLIVVFFAVFSTVSSFQLECYQCDWFNIIAESNTDAELGGQLAKLSEYRCLYPEDDAPRKSCQTPVAGYVNKCLLINGTMFADTPYGTLSYHAKMRRCVAVPKNNILFEDSCAKDPDIYGTTADMLRVVPNFGQIRLLGNRCYCSGKNCNSTGKNNASPWLLCIFTFLTFLSSLTLL